MQVREFENLKEKVQELISLNLNLMHQKRSFSERLQLQEKEIKRLRARCAGYERAQREATRRINDLLQKLEVIEIF